MRRQEMMTRIKIILRGMIFHVFNEKPNYALYNLASGKIEAFLVTLKFDFALLIVTASNSLTRQ